MFSSSSSFFCGPLEHQLLLLHCFSPPACAHPAPRTHSLLSASTQEHGRRCDTVYARSPLRRLRMPHLPRRHLPSVCLRLSAQGVRAVCPTLAQQMSEMPQGKRSAPPRPRLLLILKLFLSCTRGSPHELRRCRGCFFLIFATLCFVSPKITFILTAKKSESAHLAPCPTPTGVQTFPACWHPPANRPLPLHNR